MKGWISPTLFLYTNTFFYDNHMLVLYFPLQHMIYFVKNLIVFTSFAEGYIFLFLTHTCLLNFLQLSLCTIIILYLASQNYCALFMGFLSDLTCGRLFGFQ